MGQGKKILNSSQLVLPRICRLLWGNMRAHETSELQDLNHQWSSGMCRLPSTVVTDCVGFCKSEVKLLIRKSLPGMVGYTCTPSTREVEARYQVQGQHHLLKKLETSLVCVRPCLNKPNKSVLPGLFFVCLFCNSFPQEKLILQLIVIKWKTLFPPKNGEDGKG